MDDSEEFPEERDRITPARLNQRRVFIRRLHELVADEPNLILLADLARDISLPTLDDVLDVGGHFGPKGFLFSFPAVGGWEGYRLRCSSIWLCARCTNWLCSSCIARSTLI